jgi:hypothetical protein
MIVSYLFFKFKDNLFIDDPIFTKEEIFPTNKKYYIEYSYDIFNGYRKKVFERILSELENIVYIAYHFLRDILFGDEPEKSIKALNGNLTKLCKKRMDGKHTEFIRIMYAVDYYEVYINKFGVPEKFAFFIYGLLYLDACKENVNITVSDLVYLFICYECSWHYDGYDCVNLRNKVSSFLSGNGFYVTRQFYDSLDYEYKKYM